MKFRGVEQMKKAVLVLYIVFLVLTFSGGIFVIANRGEVNAGYAVIPMLGCLIFQNLYRGKK